MITFHFPPDGSVGGQRWAGITKYLARRGWDVHVITAAAQTGREAGVANGVHIHHCPRRRTLNDLYASWRQRRQSGPSAVQATSGGSSVAPRRGTLASWRRNAAAALGFPDAGRGWILRAARTARRLRATRHFDAIVSSGPPHSAHLAAVLSGGRADGTEPLWVDMRDPWAALVHTSWLQGLYGSTLMKRAIPRIERWVFRRAHGVIANTSEFADDLRRTNPGLRVSHVPNGIDLERLPPPSDKFEGLSLAYAGSLYAGRHLGLVIAALRDFLASRPQARAGVRLRIAGRTEAPHIARFWADVDAAGLRDVVDFRGELSPSDALGMVNRSHLALVLAQDQPMQVPAKLYESVGLGIPTVVIAEPTSAASRAAQRIGALPCAVDDLAGMVRIVERVWNRETLGQASPAEISYARIAEEVESLLLMDVSAWRSATK